MYLFRLGFALCLITAHASPTKHNRNRQSPPAVKTNTGPLRRTRQAAPPRKLNTENDILSNFLPLAMAQGPIGGILSVPRDIIQNFVGAGAPAVAAVNPAEVQRGLGDIVDKTRNAADASLDTMEQLAQGVAQRSRSALDRATSRAAGFVDHSVALSSNSLGAGLDAARGLQNEAKRVASQAAGVANGAVKAGELALAGAFDRLATAVNSKYPTQDTLVVQGMGQGGLNGLLNPLNNLIGLASGSI